MKESKFIELLNLYVDHHLSPAEAEELEAEVRSNPRHRRIYREYCEMQKACSVLADNFRAQAPASEAQVIDFRPRRSARPMVYVAGLVAAAACAALVVGIRARLSTPAVAPTPTFVRTSPVPATSPSPMMARAVTARPALQPVFGPRMLTLRDANNETAELAPRDEAFGDWMSNIQLSSIPGASAEDLRVDPRAIPQPDIRSYRAAHPLQGKVEWTAFTFQK